MSLERSITAAQGYLELDMPAEALEELEALPNEIAGHSEIVQLKLIILMRLMEWQKALDLCYLLQDQFKKLTIGYIHGAYCLHEMGRTQEAKELLINGPAHLFNEPLFHYNLGCYEAVLGNLDAAIEHLKSSFMMDDDLRNIARRDPDLEMVSHRL